MERIENRSPEYWLGRAAEAEATAEASAHQDIVEAYRQLATTYRLLASSLERLSRVRLAKLEDGG